jgi:4-azaleucine resistance transporter AzlC
MQSRREAQEQANQPAPEIIPTSTSSPTHKFEFWSGVRDVSPILLGVLPFGLIYGASAINTHISAYLAQVMSSIVFAGSAQIITTQLIGAGTSGLVILMVIFVVNLRHVLYSASVAPQIRDLSLGWKLLLAYLLTDEAYAVTITHYNKEGNPANKNWYFLGAGLTLWLTWQISTAVGIFLGAKLPTNLPLEFVLPLTFIALVIPSVKDKASVAAAISAAIIGLLTTNFPLKTGLLAAAFIGIATGMIVEGKSK